GIRSLGARRAAARAASFLAATTVVALPALLPGFLPPTSAPLTSETAQGNLIDPLGPARLAGVWPAGDFRGDPVHPALAGVLIGVAFAAALVGALAAWRRRAWPIVWYTGGVLGAALVILAAGSPWVGAKALAIAAPAVPALAMGGAAYVWA